MTDQATPLSSIVVHGDTSKLSPQQRSDHYLQMCESLGLNPHSQPFAYLNFQGKQILYVTRGATDQLAAIHRLNREIIDGPKIIDLAGTKLVLAVCRATHPNGRFETATATVPFVDPVNVLMKAETKAKRRATLSILGLGLLDETEADQLIAQGATEGPGIDLGAGSQSSKAEQPKADEQLEASAEEPPPGRVKEPPPPQGKPDPAPPSRAWASFCSELPKLTSVRAVADLYQALQRDLQEEGIDPAEYVQDTAQGAGGGTLARQHIAALGHRCSSAELQELLVNPEMGAFLDGQTEVSTLPQAALWWRKHRAAAKALGATVGQGVFYALARRLAADLTPASTKKAVTALKDAVAAADRADGPKPPGGGGGAPAPSAPSNTSTVGASTPTAPAGSPAVAAFKEHLRTHKSPGGVAGSFWAHRDEFEDCEAEARGAVIDELERRNVRQPHTYLDAIGEKNGYLRRELEAA